MGYSSDGTLPDFCSNTETRYKRYYMLLNKWLKLQQKNHNLSDYLINKGFRNIAIYGCGEIGKNLWEELKATPIKVSCFLVQTIDPKTNCASNALQQVEIDKFGDYQKDNSIDLIIITPIYDGENIRNQLNEKGITCCVVSLEELIEEFSNELKITENLVAEIKQLDQKMKNLAERIKILEAVHPQTLWLYKNAIERMDANVELFPPERRFFHQDRYCFASNYVKNKRVADIACGTGYGSKILRVYGQALEVIGIDIDSSAISYANLNHRFPQISYICTSADQTGLPDETLDVVVSFETIEHVPDDERLLKEFHRILKPGGIFICSTPNNWPIADFHLRSYDRKQFETALKRCFKNIQLFNQNSGTDYFYNHGQAAGICLTTIENEDLAECFIAVCQK